MVIDAAQHHAHDLVFCWLVHVLPALLSRTNNQRTNNPMKQIGGPHIAGVDSEGASQQIEQHERRGEHLNVCHAALHMP